MLWPICYFKYRPEQIWPILFEISPKENLADVSLDIAVSNDMINDRLYPTTIPIYFWSMQLYQKQGGMC